MISKNENKELIKYENNLLKKVSNTITVTNKLLSLPIPQLIPYRYKDKWGFCTSNKRIFIDCIFDDANPFSDDLARIKINEQVGFIEKSGTIAFMCLYDDVLPFSNGFAITFRGNKCGIINKKNEVVVEPRYDLIYPFNVQGMTKIIYKGKSGFINNNCQEIIPCVYEDVDNFNDNLACFKLNQKSGIMNKLGEHIIQPVYDSLFILSSQFILAEENGRYFYINSTGEKVSANNQEFASLFTFGFTASLNNDSKWGFVDFKNNLIIPHLYEEVTHFEKNGLARVKLNKKYGYIDKFGQQIINCKYDNLGSFNEDLAYFKINNKFGFINSTGEEVIHPVYDNVNIFKEGIALVHQLNSKGYINKEGIEYWED